MLNCLCGAIRQCILDYVFFVKNVFVGIGVPDGSHRDEYYIAFQPFLPLAAGLCQLGLSVLPQQNVKFRKNSNQKPLNTPICKKIFDFAPLVR